MAKLKGSAAKLLSEINAYLEAADMPAYIFGKKTGAGVGFVSSLEGGRDIRLSTYDAVREWMASHPPRPKT